MKRSDYKQIYTYARFKVRKATDDPELPFFFAYYYRNKLMCHIELIPQEPITSEAKVIKFIPMRRILLTEDHRFKVITLPFKYITKPIYNKPDEDGRYNIYRPGFHKEWRIKKKNVNPKGE